MTDRAARLRYLQKCLSPQSRLPSPFSHNHLTGDPRRLPIGIAFSQHDAARNSTTGCAIQPPVTAEAVDGPPDRQARTMLLRDVRESQHDLPVALGAV